jgi:hypothetical protein
MRYTFLTAMAIAALALSACNFVVPGAVVGSGKIVTESRPVSGFTKVDLSGVGDLMIDVNGSEALTIEGDDNIVPLIVTEVRGDTLHIGFKERTPIQRVSRLRYTLSAKALDGLTLSGAGNVTASNIDTPSMEVVTSGAGRINMSGKATNEVVTLTGAGSFEGENLLSETASVNTSGVGRAIVNAAKKLDVSISGAGSVEYIGSPQVTQQVSGIGTVKQRQP